MKTHWIIGCITLLVLASCQSSAQHQYAKGDELAVYDFSQPRSFEEGGYGAATLRVQNGVYLIDVMQGDNVMWWGQWGDDYADTIIDVDIDQITEPVENAYGVMCRVRGAVGQQQPLDPTLAAVLTDTPSESTPELLTPPTAEMTAEFALEPTSEATLDLSADVTPDATAETDAEMMPEVTVEMLPEFTLEAALTAEASAAPLLTATPQPTLSAVSEGDGYLFLIQGSGAFAIMRARGRHLTPLVDWTPSNAINRGMARNHIRAVCVGDYLAMYVNNEFMGDTTDDTFARGQVGLAASAANRLGTRITFDNLTISSAAQ